jgi:hypothetical protein
MQVTDLAPAHRTINASRALYDLDTTQLRADDPIDTLLELVVRAHRDGKPIALHMFLDLLTGALDQAKVNGKPLHLFARAIDERRPGEHAAAFAALPESEDFGGYIIDAVRRASTWHAEVH